jgi:hypothetical protein
MCGITILNQIITENMSFVSLFLKKLRIKNVNFCAFL